MPKTNQLESGPVRHKISSISTLVPDTIDLGSGMSLYAFHTKDIGALKFEILFEAGRLYEAKRLVSQATGVLLSEGCKRKSSFEVSEIVDYEGAYLTSYANSDFISVRLTSAKKSFSKLVDLVREILEEPSFSDEEIVNYKERTKQKMLVNLSKNDVMSYRTLTAKVYGEESAYGYNSSIEMLDKITSNDLFTHFNTNCHKTSGHLFLSGDYDDDHIRAIDKLSEVIKEGKKENISTLIKGNTASLIGLSGRENQASLKLGTLMFDRTHKDYPGIYLLNTILGGYFGSRLMKNIREKRGYTYNIYSMLDTYKYTGAWIISSELDQTNVDKTIDQINLEFETLKNTPIGEEELSMVKNYLLGNFMSTINGPFKAINPFKTQKLMGLENTFYNNLYRTIQNFDQEDVLRLANEFLEIDKFWKVIVGKA